MEPGLPILPLGLAPLVERLAGQDLVTEGDAFGVLFGQEERAPDTGPLHPRTAPAAEVPAAGVVAFWPVPAPLPAAPQASVSEPDAELSSAIPWFALRTSHDASSETLSSPAETETLDWQSLRDPVQQAMPAPGPGDGRAKDARLPAAGNRNEGSLIDRGPWPGPATTLAGDAAPATLAPAAVPAAFPVQDAGKSGLRAMDADGWQSDLMPDDGVEPVPTLSASRPVIGAPSDPDIGRDKAPLVPVPGPVLSAPRGARPDRPDDSTSQAWAMRGPALLEGEPLLPKITEPAEAPGIAGERPSAAEKAGLPRRTDAAMPLADQEEVPVPPDPPVLKSGASAAVPDRPDFHGHGLRMTGVEGLWLGSLRWYAATDPGSAGRTRVEDALPWPVRVATTAPLHHISGPTVEAYVAVAASETPDGPAAVIPGDFPGSTFAPDLGLSPAGPMPANPTFVPGNAGTGPVPGAVGHLSVQIAASLALGSDGLTEIALSPEELGSVRLKLQPDALDPDRMIVHLVFDRPETMDLFRRHADQLAEAIRSAGYAEARIDFGQSGPGPDSNAGHGLAGGRNDEADRAPPRDPGDRAGDTDPERPFPMHQSVAAGLDMRL